MFSWNRYSDLSNSGLRRKVFSALPKKKKSDPASTSVPRFSSGGCVVRDPGVSCLETVWHIKHIFSTMSLCGLAPNLINCENVVGGMSQLSVAPQSIPEESPSVLSPSAFPSALPDARVTSRSHAFHKKNSARRIVVLSVGQVTIMAMSDVVLFRFGSKMKKICKCGLKLATNWSAVSICLYRSEKC